jgi:hypothetical protein
MSAAHAVEPLANGVETAGVSRSRVCGSAGICGISAGTAVSPAGGGTVESRASVCCSAADAGASVVFMPVKYRESAGRAMGAVWERSKPKGLDVGVLPHGFFRIRRDSCSDSGLLLTWRIRVETSIGGRSVVGRRLNAWLRSAPCALLRLDMEKAHRAVELDYGVSLSRRCLGLVGGGSC